LDQHIKNENEVLRNNMARLQKENEQLEIEKKKLEKQVRKWYVRNPTCDDGE
jgi:regulator of replication initiation timing